MLDQSHQDVEVRVYVDENCQLSVEKIEIIKILPADFVFVNVSHEKDLKWSSVLYRSWEKLVYPKSDFYWLCHSWLLKSDQQFNLLLIIN